MIDIICTQRIKPGMEAQAETVLREAQKETLAHDKGCERYEWYRSEEPSTYVLIERWTDREARSPAVETDLWTWTQLVGLAVLTGGFGIYFWNVGASRLGVAVASLWINLVPFFAVLWAMAYGFVPNIYQIAGGLVALSGVVYMQWRKLHMAAG